MKAERESKRSSLSKGIAWPFFLACLAFLILQGRSLVGPVLCGDDFDILSHERTWQRTCDSFWLPQNEHAMPLGRVLCFGLEWVAGSLSHLPFLTCLVGPSALLMALGLLYVFVLRELNHPFYALLSVVLFAVTSIYHQAVWWFAACFALLSVITLLLGLLAAQRWRRQGGVFSLALCVLACLLAPGWFALGILAGPLCCLYLLPPTSSANRTASGSVRWLPSPTAFLPLVGTALFLALVLPRAGNAILHTGHYGERTALQAFNAWFGLGFTARSLVDNLLLGLFGVTNVALPLACVVPLLIAMIAAAVWWWRQARDHRLMLLGVGMIGSAYLLCYSARAQWEYRRMVEPAFARYHLLPYLGLVLFFCGGLPGRAGRWFMLDEAEAIPPRQRRFFYKLIGILLIVHLPRGLLCGSPTGWTQFAEVRAQQAALRRIEEVDTRCRRYHISAESARQALGRFEVPLSLGVGDGWDFLIGSDDPHPLPPEQVKRLLTAP